MARFRFTIRDLLWIVVVVGLAMGWWRDHSGLSERLVFLRANYMHQTTSQHRRITYLKEELEARQNHGATPDSEQR